MALVRSRSARAATCDSPSGWRPGSDASSLPGTTSAERPWRMSRSSHDPVECSSRVGWGINVLVESTEPPYAGLAIAHRPPWE